jgi:hypothetical protein
MMLLKRPSRLLMYVVTMHYEKHSQGGECDANVGSSGGSGSFLYSKIKAATGARTW